MQNPRLASRYAKSLMDIAIEQNAVEPIYQDMLSMQQIFDGNRDLVAMVHSPIITTDKKQSIFNAADNLNGCYLFLFYFSLQKQKTTNEFYVYSNIISNWNDWF